MPNPIQTIKAGFRLRAMPLAADYRPLYKIGQIILILRLCSHGERASLNKLHFLINAIKSSRNILAIRRALELNDVSRISSWGAEPALNKALKLGVAEGLFSLHEDKYTLSDSGKTLGEKIEADESVFAQEKELLHFMGKKTITEAFIKDLTNKMTT
ncbi:MAG: hypothetical protein DI535_16400 [Citrobacter freundii]|nr:MAG: hypothetical protein DI535_16400 [Citrobacter freundii]